ncbi:hypothetical protein Tco_0729498 [Tanacetum coccineum]|uniref:Uncharacterized protein n=1 Tax=Tanacetum coccineum TaxID=301880 RepID=A0ABQ4YRT6_9ASTR
MTLLRNEESEPSIYGIELIKREPLKKSEVTQMMRNLVKNQWCAAHNGTITMKDVKAMNQKQLVEEYEYISSVPAATTHTADDPDSAGGGSSNPAGGAFGAPVTDSTVTTPAAMDSAGQRRRLSSSPFANLLHPSPSESESDDDMENYIPPLPYGAFKDWEIVSCPLRNTYTHVYHQENRQKYFIYLKELLPHVYREDLLLFVTLSSDIRGKLGVPQDNGYSQAGLRQANENVLHLSHIQEKESALNHCKRLGCNTKSVDSCKVLRKILWPSLHHVLVTKSASPRGTALGKRPAQIP